MASIISEKLSGSGITLTILGCGEMGTAVLSGLLAALNHGIPTIRISHIVACVRTTSSAEALSKAFSHDKCQPCEVIVLDESTNGSLTGVQLADVVLLGCKPDMAESILQNHDMKKALRGKLLISMLAGVTTLKLKQYLNSGDYATYNSALAASKHEIQYPIIRVMPNIASRIRQGMTVIEEPQNLPADFVNLTSDIFSGIGTVKFLPPNTMDVCSILNGSSQAFVSLVLDGLLDGAVDKGLSRADARDIASQAMMGLAALVRSGENPGLLRESMCSPGGCTIRGLAVLEQAAVRGTVAKATVEATEKAATLAG
ncbi:MAG: delta 1-pyrroline-5-carboxylate reductase [Cirrosporium novae-zelandiae]|nr:MAG: delta 1-pyrroline-5-carboxylate reductase [Cirrosporium novae-zelandiae]